MGDKLKTQTVTFSSLFDSKEQDVYLAPEKRYENLTTNQIQATQLVTSTSVEKQQQIQKEVQKESVLKNTDVEKINPYYSYMPKFYKAEIRHARLAFVLSLIAFIIILVGSVSLVGLALTAWEDTLNPWILFLLILPNAVTAILLAVTTTRYRSFLYEAKHINFRDEKVLSINVQKLYRRLKTNWIDLVWFSALGCVLLLIGILVDAICVSAIAKAPFGNFWAPCTSDNADYTYVAIFVSFVVVVAILIINFVLTFISSYLRASNIDNYYNYSIVDPTEIQEIKKRKNKRDLIIFFAVIATVIFVVWLITRLVLNKRKQVPTVTAQI